MAIGDKVKRYLAEKEAKRKAAEAGEPFETVIEDDENDLGQTPVELADAPALSLTFEQLKELLGSRDTISAEELAAAIAEGTAKATMPENRRPPQISVYNPLGERDHPKTKLKAAMFFGSAPLGSPRESHTLTEAEIVALNTLQPGFFRVTKNDGTTQVLEIRGQVNSNRTLERVWIVLPAGDEDKNGYPSLVSIAAQCSDANRVEPVSA